MNDMKKIVACLLLLIAASPLFAAQRTDAVRSAREVLVRTIGSMPQNVVLRHVPGLASEACDGFEHQARKGVLYVSGSSPVAICRGFYDYLTANGYGTVTWSGSRIELPARFPDSPRRRVVSPFRHRLYYNVCTNGYTTPYWGWQEWEKEIDWMALHGFDMSIAPIAGEAVFARVWRELGLSDREINDYFTGPGHMPWMRMGNMSQLDGAPSQAWHEAQIALQHKIVDRMRELGMKPVFQGFAGFVPKAMKEHYPEINLTTTRWNGFNSYMLSPLDSLFTEIAKRYIETWEAEFGKGTYYLIDSFNELDIPFGEQGSRERFDLLQSYSKVIYNALRSANPDAVWVMQGWIFGHQRVIWDPQSIEALLSGVPDDRMLIIDLAVDFNRFVWQSKKTWEYVPGLFGKQWIYSTTPNFGGRNALTGVLESYANGHLEALRDPARGALVGYGTSPEGVEQNEVGYELIADAGWRDREIDLQEYLAQYSTARYGSCPEPMRAFWREMTQSAYGSFTNNARFNWQQRPVAGRVPTMGINGHYYRAIENFLACDIHSELYRTDAIALAAFYLAAKADDLLDKINWAYVAGNTSEVPAFERQFLNLLAEADCLLESHPVFRLQRWVDLAGRAGQSPEERDRFTGELRRLVTVWGGPHLSDYSARVWSGLIRDYYLPRWEHYFIAKRTGGAFDFRNHDEWYHSARGISHVTPYRDPLASARRLVENAGEISSVNDYRPAGAVAFISPFEHLYERTRLTFSVRNADYRRAAAVRFRCTRGTETATIGSILFRGHRENLSSYEVNRTIAAGEVVEVPIRDKRVHDALPQEVTLQIEVRGHRALDNYMSVELVYE